MFQEGLHADGGVFGLEDVGECLLFGGGAVDGGLRQGDGLHGAGGELGGPREGGVVEVWMALFGSSRSPLQKVKEAQWRTDEEKLAVFRRVRNEIRRTFTAYADGRRDQLKS